jgi:hypothetical protein
MYSPEYAPVLAAQTNTWGFPGVTFEEKHWGALKAARGRCKLIPRLRLQGKDKLPEAAALDATTPGRPSAFFLAGGRVGGRRRRCDGRVLAQPVAHNGAGPTRQPR